MLNTMEHPYPTMELADAAAVLGGLHERVCSQHSRVEITRPGSSEICVMLTKQELDMLEHAMDIFADTDAFEQMCRDVQQILETAGVVYGGLSAAD
jgi:hypothetical protein